MTSEIPVTQARDELADLINRVAYGHERIVLTRHSKPVACLVPPEDLERLERENLERENLALEGTEQVTLTSAGPAAESRQPSPPAGPLPMAAQYQPPPQPRH